MMNVVYRCRGSIAAIALLHGCLSAAPAFAICDPAPREDCFNSKGKLSIKNYTENDDDKFSLSLKNGPPALREDFGDPVATDSYDACIYDAAGLVEEVTIAAGGTCDGEPCWQATKRGYSLKDGSGTNEGITAVSLKGSDKSKTAIKIKGKGANLDDPILGWSAPIAAQVVNPNTGKCFGAVLGETGTLKKSTSEILSAKSEYQPGLGKAKRELSDDLTSMDGEGTERQAAPNPAEVYVQSITYGGSGCPNGSVVTSFSNDRKAFTLIFDQMVAAAGSGIAPLEGSKSCQLNINLRIPNGFSYSVASSDYRGYVSLPPQVTATQKSTYYFQGEVTQASAGTSFRGPLAGRDYLARDTLGLAATVWMPCNRIVPLNIHTMVRLSPALGPPAQITVDSIDGKVKHVIGLQFRPC